MEPARSTELGPTDEAVEMNPPGTGGGRGIMERKSGRVTVTADGRRTRNIRAAGVSDHSLTKLRAKLPHSDYG